MALMPFIFGGNTGIRTPQEAARLRAIAEALSGQRRAPHTIGEGLSAIGDAIAERRAVSRADRIESEGRAAYDAKYGDLVKSLISGGRAAPTVPDAPVAGDVSISSYSPPDDVTGQPDLQTAGISIDAEPGQLDQPPDIAPRQAQPQPPGVQQVAANGFDPRLIDALSDPWIPEGQKAVLEELFKQQMKANEPTDYGFKEINGDLFSTDPRTGQVKKVFDNPDAGQPGGPADEYGLTPVYGQDAEGNLVILQTSKSGKVKQPELPPGFKLTPGTQKIDLGTKWGIYDTKSGTMIGLVDKDVAGKASQEEQGTATGKAVVNLPGVEEAASRAFGTIDDLLNDPALPNLTGAVESRLPTYREDTARAEAKLKLIQGQVFLQAYNDLRGAGQISEQEGQAAKEAYSRLSATGVSDPDFVKALHDYRIELQKLVNVARQKAGQPPLPIDEGSAAASPEGSPKPGHIEDGYRFKGGDPADRNSWEPVS